MGRDDGLKKKRELKLAMLGALVRSQQALAQILEHAAAMFEHTSIADAEQVRKQISAVCRMQAALSRAMLQIGADGPICRTMPGKPWLHRKVQQGEAERRLLCYHGNKNKRHCRPSIREDRGEKGENTKSDDQVQKRTNAGFAPNKAKAAHETDVDLRHRGDDPVRCLGRG